MNFKKYLKVFVTASCLVTMVGCQTTTGTSTEASSATSEVSSEVEASESDYTIEDLFTNRDYEVGYEEEEATTIDVSEYNNETVSIKDEGTYIITGTASNVQILVDASDAKIQLVLDGANITNTDSAVIFVNDADKVFVTLASGSSNTLSCTSDIQSIGDVNVDGVIFARCDLTLNGEGTLNITAATGNGIVSKDDLAVTSGTYVIDAGNHGIQGKDSVRISSGSLNITSGEDAIHSDNDEDDGKGFIYIAGGTIEISAGDDGIHAQTDLTIDGGTINIAKSYEGLEGHTITINDGDISVVSSDDGLNAAGGNDSSGWGFDDPMASDEDAWIIINGGTLQVVANGDGIDSNGDLTVNGGYITVDGPSDSANGALDFGGTGTINGGTLIAVGSSGMAQNFGNTSTQASIYVATNSNVSGDVTLTDSDGNVLITYSPSKTYNSAVISSADLEVGKTYIVTLGDTSTEVELTDLIYGNPDGMGGMGGGQMGDHGGMGGGRQNSTNQDKQRPNDQTDLQEGTAPSDLPEGTAPSDRQENQTPSGDMPNMGEGQQDGQMPGGNQPSQMGNAPGQMGQAPNNL